MKLMLFCIREKRLMSDMMKFEDYSFLCARPSIGKSKFLSDIKVSTNYQKPDFNLDEITDTPDWYSDYMKQVDSLVDQIDNAIGHIWYEECHAHGLKTFDMFVGYIRYNIADVYKLFDAINNSIHIGIGEYFESYKTFNLCFPNAEQKQTFLCDSNLAVLRTFWDKIEEENNEMFKVIDTERNSIQSEN